MDNLRDQTARMRKTFRYPADEETESVDSQPEAMDEEGTSLRDPGRVAAFGVAPVTDVAKQSRKSSSSASLQRIQPATPPSPRH